MERLRVLGAIRVAWYQLYVVDKQIETTQANQQLLQSLIDVATARIATGQASQGDVLLGMIELSQLRERLLEFPAQRQAIQAEINRLAGRPKTQWREGVSSKDIWDQVNAVATLPGVTPASPLQPIEGRVSCSRVASRRLW